MDYTKTDSYYESLDKRTKEYKEWKERFEAAPEGLGDTIEKVTEKTGIKSVAENIAKKLGFDDCGCEKRKDLLNKYFRYRHPLCLEEQEFIWLSEFFSVNRSRVLIGDQREMLSIYNRVFQSNQQPSSCSGCWREISKKMQRLMQIHKEQ